MLTTAAGRFRIIAIAEAASWAGLLIGMFFKYVVVLGEAGVEIFGPIHGAMFLGYVALTLLAAQRLNWPRRVTALALLASIPPFGSVIFERWATRRDKLDEAMATAS